MPQWMCPLWSWPRWALWCVIPLPRKVCSVFFGFGEKQKWLQSLSLKCFPLTVDVFDDTCLCGCECRVRMVVPVAVTHGQKQLKGDERPRPRAGSCRHHPLRCVMEALVWPAGHYGLFVSCLCFPLLTKHSLSAGCPPSCVSWWKRHKRITVISE